MGEKCCGDQTFGCCCFCNLYMRFRYFNCSLHVVIMILSIVLFKTHDVNYGKIINNETTEWGTAAILDIRGLYYYTSYTDGIHAGGYSNVEGMFSGTDPYCPDGNN